MSKAYINEVVSNYNTQAEMGKYVEEAAVAHMVEDILQDRKELHFSLYSKEVNKDLKQLADALKQFCVSDLEIVDKNHNGKVDKGDKIKMSVTESGFLGMEEHNAKELTIGAAWNGPFQYSEKGVSKVRTTNDKALTIGSGAAVSTDGTIPDGHATKAEQERAARGEAP